MTGNDIAVQPLAFFGEPLDEGGGVGDFALRFGQRLALLGGHEGREILLVLHDEIEPAAQHDRAVLGGARRPGGQRLGGGRNRAPRLCGAHVRDDAQRFPRCRIVHRQSAAVVRQRPAAVDEALLAQQPRIFQFHFGSAISP